MASQTDARATREILQERLRNDATLLKDSATLLGFAAAASAGFPSSLGAGIELILKSAGAALSAGLILVKRLSSREKSTKLTFRDYDRFKVLFYVTCQRAYIEAIDNLLPVVWPESETEPTVQGPSAQRLTDIIQMKLANLEEAEISYLYGVAPLDGARPLFRAFEDWLQTTLTYYGADASLAHVVAEKITDDAESRLFVLLADSSADAQWMRQYLVLASDLGSFSSNDLSSIRRVMENWTTRRSTKQSEAWEKYRLDLRRLPDLKDSMFDEDFGVRRVFVMPRVAYSVAGDPLKMGTSAEVPDVGALVGALLSRRTPNDDLIILSGGPGSGKSTLCRFIASELASDAAIHPVFLRLRRIKEGADIGAAVEDTLRRVGIIKRLAELREIPNVVLILDGFDELVMANRTRLRHFFNLLQEEHSTGALREAKILISGRDTLFPKGEGFPAGSHLLTLLPFASEQVDLWARKWRGLHAEGSGSTFYPENLLEREPAFTKTPLHHLVTWPLTLHLIARIHTSGKLDVSGPPKHEIEKAYLYRSILAETSTRQTEQTQGRGRLDPQQMRVFLRSLAWKMYTESRDTMDATEVVPLLVSFLPGTSEADLSELADVAIVNSPQLTRGEETGFEFVHKSFAEYLTAEEIAFSVESIAYKAPQWDDELTWRMSDQEAHSLLASKLVGRVLTAEVQEMLEPMLGAFGEFLKGVNVEDVVRRGARQKGLTNVLRRMEALAHQHVSGEVLELVIRYKTSTPLVQGGLEAVANYLAGLLILGSAAVRQFSKDQTKRQEQFAPFRSETAFWRAIAMLVAGGVQLDERLSPRMFEGMSSWSMTHLQRKHGITDISNPFRPAELLIVDGFESRVTQAVKDCIAATSFLHSVALTFALFAIRLGFHTSELATIAPLLRQNETGTSVPELEPLLSTLHEAGIIRRWDVVDVKSSAAMYQYAITNDEEYMLAFDAVEELQKLLSLSPYRTQDAQNAEVWFRLLRLILDVAERKALGTK